MRLYISILTLLSVSVLSMAYDVIGTSDLNTRVFEDLDGTRIYISKNEERNRIITKKKLLSDRIENFIAYDLNSKTKIPVLPDTIKNRYILAMIYELHYADTTHKMVMNGFISPAEYQKSTRYIINNSSIPTRSTSAQILLLVKNESAKINELWLCNKYTLFQTCIAVLKGRDTWHLDIKNKKIRVIAQIGSVVTVEEFDW